MKSILKQLPVLILKVCPPALRPYLNKILFYGRARYCPVCQSSLRRFVPQGRAHRASKCPVCRTVERHRLVWLFFQERTDLFDGRPKIMLHVAPEPVIEPQLAKLPNLDYVTADLFAPNVRVKMDVMDIQFPDNHFDVIYCSHVLEHVPDDKKAMREFRRVLKPGGWAVLQVPMIADKTWEDASITDPKEREREFGQDDHVRRYGPDYKERLEAQGFKVRAFPSTEVAGEKNMTRLGLDRKENVYYCTKDGAP